MHFDLGFGKNDYEEAIRFLNSPAWDFYCGNNTYRDSDYPLALKAALQTGFVDLERTLRGTFDSDLHMDNANKEMLELMFPNAFGKLFRLNSPEDLRKVGFLMESLRNINSHAIISDNDKRVFGYPFGYLKFAKPINRKIKYYDNGITMAGVVYIILNFLREQSIAILTKKDYIFGLVSRGYYGIDDGTRFVNEISHVDLETDIRKEMGTSISKAVLGEYESIATRRGGDFEIKIGIEPHPTYKVNGHIDDKNILIRKSSLTKIFYDEDYTLNIEDVQGFTELSNLLPPLVLVDYLYGTKVNSFNNIIYKQLKNSWGIISKLNKPKFYSDKNLKILLMPNTVSDFRLMSGIISDCLQKVFLMIENYIYAEKQIDTKGQFSTIMDAFKEVDANKDLSLNIALLRNMVSHGYILDEYFMFKNRLTIYSIDFVVEVLFKILNLFKDDKETYAYLGMIIKTQFLDTVVAAKYKQAGKFCYSLLDTYPNFDEKELAIKNSCIEHSMLDVNQFKCLMINENDTPRIIKIILEGFPTVLYLLNIDSSNEKLKAFCENNRFIIKTMERHGFFIDYKIVRQ